MLMAGALLWLNLSIYSQSVSLKINNVPVKKAIANTHSGWKGTIQRIAVKTVEKMIKEFECNPKDIICCICPSIRKCHFEVEKDVKDMFENEFKDLETYAKHREIYLGLYL